MKKIMIIITNLMNLGVDREEERKQAFKEGHKAGVAKAVGILEKEKYKILNEKHSNKAS